MNRPCPRCQGPTRVYYDWRNTWAVCLSCRLGRWIGTGFALPPSAADAQGIERWYADTGARRPPAGAIHTTATFWRAIDQRGERIAP